MKITFLLISIFFLGSLQAQDFEIVEATSQKWTGGRARSGYGVNYNITMVCKKKIKKIDFEKLWVMNEVFPLKISKNSAEKATFLKGDTLFLVARKKVKTNEYGDAIKEEKKTEKPPVDFKTEALISYQYKRKSKYLLIPEFKKLKAIYYP